MKTTALVGRILFSLLFIMAASGHFKAATIAYAAAQGVPLASLAVPASGILALGYKARWGAVAIVAFLAPVTVMMHNFWAVTDPMMQQLQMSMFMKNLALIGGALTFAVYGAGAYSLDARLERRAGTTPSVALRAA
jgi:putative oxidoreductase